MDKRKDNQKNHSRGASSRSLALCWGVSVSPRQPCVRICSKIGREMEPSEMGSCLSGRISHLQVSGHKGRLRSLLFFPRLRESSRKDLMGHTCGISSLEPRGQRNFFPFINI